MPITLSARSVRRAALAGAAATLSIALAACGASFSAQTSQPYQAAEGTNASSGGIVVRNLLVLASEDGKGELHGVVVNNGTATDTLVSVTQAAPGTPDGQDGSDQPGVVTFGKFEALPLQVGAALTLPQTPGVEAPATTPSTTPTAVPTDAPTATPATPTAAPAKPFSVTGAKPGQMVNVTLTFAKAAPITTYVPVLTEDHYTPTPRDDAPAGEH
ncbi:hypothetical protein ACFVWG_07045 [Kribbella sp. NPDC058245]|uniref:hypothetical protein n=1 Tax=Kribbella sp. NPDC058245 TaxID=3346399 RepID=UPI0036E5A5C8